jgi:transposase InsO family protein
MINRNDDLPVSRQAKVLGISRGSVYYLPRPVSADDLALMRRIDELHLDYPFAGSRMLQTVLAREGYDVGRLHVARLMKRMGIEAIYRRPNTSKPAPGHTIFPYLLRKLPVTRPNQVWAMDITYIPMARGFVYLAAVVDWFSRKVLAWKLSITLETEFCLEAVGEAVARYGKPEIFNSRLPVHQHRLHRPAAQERDQDQHGWERRLARQHLRRAPVADHQIRGGVPTGIRQCPGGTGLHRTIYRRLLQCQKAPLEP